MRFAVLPLLALLALSPSLALADMPGLPPAVPPDCPPGTRLEGPYRHWRCVPVAPVQPAVPVVDDPAPPVEPTPEPEVPPTPPSEDPSPSEPTPVPPVQAPPAAAPPATPETPSSFGCAATPRASGGAVWTLFAFALAAARIGRRRGSTRTLSGTRAGRAARSS